MAERRRDQEGDQLAPRPVVVVGPGADRPGGDVLVGGSERGPGLWRRVPPQLAVGAAVLAVLGAGLITLATGAAEPYVAPPPPLAALGPAGARLDDGRLLVRVEAELRTREPVVLRSGLVTGGGVVLLLDPVSAPEPGAPDAVRARIVALVDPGCTAEPPAVPPADPVLQVVVAPQVGGEPATLASDIPLQSFRGAARSACAPVRATAALPSGSGPEAQRLEVTVQVPDAGVPVQVLGLTGRGFQLDPAGLTEQVTAASTLGRPFEVTATAQVAVGDCFVEVLAPRRLVLEVQRGDEVLRVPVATSPDVVAALDELVRRSCRRARG